MGFIYKITNKINGKCYIGKTEQSIEKRFKQHIHDAGTERCRLRPLYRAMNKYGVENFTVETLEECEDTVSREIYWIEFYKSYGRTGYNATKGGDGRSFIDPESILSLNAFGKTNREISNLTGYDMATVRSCLVKNNRVCVPTKNKNSMAVICVELNMVFGSQHEAARFVIPTKNKHEESAVANKISLCCRNRRKSAYGYTWKYVNNL